MKSSQTLFKPVADDPQSISLRDVVKQIKKKQLKEIQKQLKQEGKSDDYISQFIADNWQGIKKKIDEIALKIYQDMESEKENKSSQHQVKQQSKA